VRYTVNRINLEASISLDRGKPIPRLLDVVALDGRAVERDGPISPTVVIGRHVPGWPVIAAPIETILLIVLLGRALVTVVRTPESRACQTSLFRRHNQTRPFLDAESLAT
jgi:hypothetical protein